MEEGRNKLTVWMTAQFVLSETDGGVARLTLNRPDVLNSFNRQMAIELRERIERAATDNTVRAVLLTGAGRAFSAGQDLSEATPTEGAMLDLAEIVHVTYSPLIRAIRKIEKPVVCAVNGVAAGAGANIALACDIVLASSDASFIQSFAKIGLIPDSGGTFFLPRLAGIARATAMMMLGEKITAARALEFGMIYRVCEPAELAAQSLEVARSLAAMPTRALGLTKRALNQSFVTDLDAQLDAEEKLQGLAGRTSDFREGVAAFLEKRKPDFTGA
jgi:2-(1,2-epoxy-1,2-dihydrophenyl)acetyl-CoA isomerase